MTARDRLDRFLADTEWVNEPDPFGYQDSMRWDPDRGTSTSVNRWVFHDYYSQVGVTIPAGTLRMGDTYRMTTTTSYTGVRGPRPGLIIVDDVYPRPRRRRFPLVWWLLGEPYRPAHSRGVGYWFMRLFDA